MQPEYRFDYRFQTGAVFPHIFTLRPGYTPAPAVQWCREHFGLQAHWSVMGEVIEIRDHDAAMEFRLRWC